MLLLKEDGDPRRQFDARLGFPPKTAGQELKRRAGLVAAALGEHAGAVELLHAVRKLPSPEYTAAHTLREGKAACDFLIVEGYEGPQPPPFGTPPAAELRAR